MGTDISNSIRTSVFDYLQKNKSIDNLNSVISSVEQIHSNFTSTQRVTNSNNERTRRTKEGDVFRSDDWGRECRLCDGRHYHKKDCKYLCRYCHVRGSHKSSECRGGRFKEKTGTTTLDTGTKIKNFEDRKVRTKLTKEQVR